MTESTEFILIRDWLAAQPDLIAISIALIAFVESLALVGVIVPGVVMLAAASMVAGTGLLTLPAALFAAFAGAVLGDGVSYWLGAAFKEDIRLMRPFCSHPEWLDRGELLFRRWGVTSVVVGRFIGPVRPIIPLVAGVLGMPGRQFFTVNIVSALGWAPVYVLPWYLLGANVKSAFTSPSLMLAFAALIAAMSGLLWWIRRHFAGPPQ